MTSCTNAALLSSQDLDRLRHMLGASPLKMRAGLAGLRNFFTCEPHGAAHEAMRALQQRGFVREGERVTSMHLFHATAAGCHAAGLDAQQTRRALAV